MIRRNSKVTPIGARFHFEAVVFHPPLQIFASVSYLVYAKRLWKKLDLGHFFAVTAGLACGTPSSDLAASPYVAALVPSRQ
jgi:hypothetical protein